MKILADDEAMNTNLKIVQICHGPIIPPYISAYSLRCHSLLSDLGSKIISIGGPIFIDKTYGNASQFRSLLLTGYSILKGNRSFEIFLSRGRFLRSRYVRKLKETVNESKFVVFEGPWQYFLVKELLKGKIVVYDAHNCETTLRTGNLYIKETKTLEEELVIRSDIVFSVTNRDLAQLMKFDESHPEKFHLIPHTLRRGTEKWKGINSNEITFIGSMYGPNISALIFVMELASKLPSFHFNIIGNVRTGFITKKLPNLTYHGIVDEKTKTKLLSNSMLALNPVSEGSGRNVKMVDYLMHSVPIVSTEIGIRGFDSYDIEQAVIVARREDFSERILDLAADREKLVEFSENAGRIYEEILDNETNEIPSELLRELRARSG